MATHLRQSSFLLRRIATPSLPSLIPLHARTYATKRPDGKPAPRSKPSIRSPLIGGFSAPQSQPQNQPQQPPAESRPAAESKPATAAMSTSPPPPPPPAAPSQAPENATASAPSENKPAHAYSATKTGNFLDMDLASIISDRSAVFGAAMGTGDPMQRPQIRAKSVIGRTVFIRERLTPNSAPTPAVALRVLDRMARQQKIRTKYHQQKFHERPGLKRKRLRSERWRTRFRTGFKAAVTRALELKKQGW